MEESKNNIQTVKGIILDSESDRLELSRDEIIQMVDKAKRAKAEWLTERSYMPKLELKRSDYEECLSNLQLPNYEEQQEIIMWANEQRFLPIKRLVVSALCGVKKIAKAAYQIISVKR